MSMSSGPPVLRTRMPHNTHTHTNTHTHVHPCNTALWSLVAMGESRVFSPPTTPFRNGMMQGKIVNIRLSLP